jgi:hypothetical protein
MSYFLFALMGAYLAVGLTLLYRGPLSRLIEDSAEEARFLQSHRLPDEPPVPGAFVSKAILVACILLLWPCLWPTAACRPGPFSR